MNLIFLQNSATQPRCQKRYRSFVKAGVKGVVYSFHRNWYNVNLPDDIEIHSLGEITPGNYFSRLLYYLKKIRPVMKENPHAVYYCYGLDMAFVALLCGRKYVYEESDLVYLSINSSIVRFLMKRLDLYVQKKSIATVFTSQGFVEYLYKKSPRNIFVLPNKLSSVYENIERPTPPDAININKLRFAFVGLLRYKTTITPFVEEMVNFNPNFEFHFWGDTDETDKAFVNALCSKYDNVSYHGPFRNPADLPAIYKSIDINFVCYETDGINQRIAEPNKLYESIYYLKPMIVSPDTYLSRVVTSIGNAFVLDCHNRQEIREFFEGLTVDSVKEKIINSSIVPASDVIDKQEDIDALIDYINNNL